MLQYDKKKNILYAYKCDAARPPLIPNTSRNVALESFNEYLNGQLRDDVMNIFMPALWNCLQVGKNLIGTTSDRIEHKQVDPGRFNDLTHHVTVRFNIARADNSQAQDVSIMCLPHVHEDGTIEYDSKRYAFTHMLEQESAVSYKSNEGARKAAELKIKNGSRTFWIYDDAKALKISFSDISGKSSKTKFKLINLIMAMAREEGYDPERIWSEFANFSIVNMFKDEQQRMQTLYYAGGNTDYTNADEYSRDLVSRVTLTRIKKNGSGDDSYNNECVRDGLNQLLSLDRAVGEELAKDVYSVVKPGELLFTAGTIIVDNIVNIMQSNGVYCIYVKRVPNTEGYFLCEDITIMSAPAGLRITPDIRESFPEEDGMYTSHYHSRLAMPIVFEAGSAVTNDMIHTLQALEYDSITVTDNKSSGKMRTLYFYEEVISNRQVQGFRLGKTGEDSNQWFYLDVNNNWRLNNGSYTTYDFVALQSFCVKLFDGKWMERVVNLDSGFRKRFVPLAEQYHRAFAYAVREGFKQMNQKLRKVYQSTNGHQFLVRDAIDNDFYPFTKYFWQYLRDEVRCVSLLVADSLHNPMAYQSACTKVKVFTANKHSVSDSQRGIAIGSFGKIDPFEIPQSNKLGVVYNQTWDVDIATNGVIKTAYHPVRKVGGRPRVILDEVIELTSSQEEAYVIGDICAFDMDADGYILNPDSIVTCRVPASSGLEKHTFKGRYVKDIQLVNVHATQMLSHVSSIIPFINCNDAARAIFADAQIKQAKGLVCAEEPDVITSAYEQFVFLNDKFGIVAKGHGIVKGVEYSHNTHEVTVSVVYDGQDGINTGVHHKFPEYFDSGYSVTKMNVLVEAGQEVNLGDVLVSSNFISDNGILMFGVNALTGYHCDGYNYEDGTHISEALCERMASYRINKEELVGVPGKTREYRMYGPYQGKYVTPTPDCPVPVAFRQSGLTGTQIKEKCLKHAYGFCESSDPIMAKRDKTHYGVTLNTVSVDASGYGDKTSNRHGNKGVASKVEPVCNMPRLANGMPLEITHNPLGVGSRMNIGQVKDIHCGLFAHVCKFKLSTDAYNSISTDEIKLLMSLTVDLMNSVGDPTPILMQYSMLPADFLQHCAEVIDHIRIYRGCFDKRGCTKVTLPDSNGIMTETEILVGYSYVFKLIQEAHKKVTARAGQTYGEAYGELTDAPIHGASVGGGQRYGTMEVDALCAMGVANYISECVNERCDNAIARDNFYIDTYLPKPIQKQFHINSPGQRRSTTQFLYSLLALGIMPEPEDGEFIPLSSENGEELAHWKPAAINRANVFYTKTYSGGQEGNSEVAQQTETLKSAEALILGSAQSC